MYIKYYNALKCYVYLSNLFRFIIKKDKKNKILNKENIYYIFKIKKDEIMIKKTYLSYN